MWEIVKPIMTRHIVRQTIRGPVFVLQYKYRHPTDSIGSWTYKYKDAKVIYD